MVARRFVSDEEFSALPDIPALGSGWLEDICALEEKRVLRLPELAKLSGEQLLRQSLANKGI